MIEKNVKPRPDLAGALALDTKLEEALKSYEVSFSLLPMIAKQTQKVAAPAATPVAKTHAAPSAKGNRKGLNRFRPSTARENPKESSNKGFQKKFGMQVALRRHQMASQFALTFL